MDEIRLKFGIFSDTWYYQKFRQKPEEIVGIGGKIIGTSYVFALYATDIDRLFNNLETCNVRVMISPTTEIRYEYWKTEFNQNSTWSLNRANGMKYSGLKTWLEGNHRIVICEAGKRNNRNYSRVLLRGAALTQGLRAFTVSQLANAIRQNVGTPEPGEGCGDAAEVATTDGILPYLALWCKSASHPEVEAIARLF